MIQGTKAANELKGRIQALLDKTSEEIRQSGIVKEILDNDKDIEAAKGLGSAGIPYILGLSMLVRDYRQEFGNNKEFRDVMLGAIDANYLWQRLKPLVPDFKEIEDTVGVVLADSFLNVLKNWVLQTWDSEVPNEESMGKDKIEEIQQVFSNLPSTPATVNLFNLFGVGSDLWENPRQVAERERALDTHKKIKIEGDATRPEILRVTIETRSALQVYELEYKYLEGTNAGLKKVYSFISSKISGIFHDGAPVKNSIEFPLQELVDSGMYKTLDTARKGFLDAGEALIRVGVKGWLRLSNKKRYEQVDVGPFFTLFRVKKGICIVKINPDFAWGMFTAFYTPLPPYAYKLPINAFTLISLIFTVARQRWEKIGKTGALKFPIKIRHIQTRLNLPDGDKTKNPRRDIRDVIEKSIEDIEASSNTLDFTITPYRASGEPIDDDDSISTYLAGYIEVELRGDYAESFKTIAINAEKRVKAAQKKKEKALSQKTDKKQ